MSSLISFSRFLLDFRFERASRHNGIVSGSAEYSSTLMPAGPGNSAACRCKRKIMALFIPTLSGREHSVIVFFKDNLAIRHFEYTGKGISKNEKYSLQEASSQVQLRYRYVCTIQSMSEFENFRCSPSWSFAAIIHRRRHNVDRPGLSSFTTSCL